MVKDNDSSHAGAIRFCFVIDGIQQIKRIAIPPQNIIKHGDC